MSRVRTGCLPMITIYAWNRAAKACRPVDGQALRDRPDELRAADVLWIDLGDPTEEEERLVFEQFFPVHPLSLGDVTRLRREPAPHLPKVEEFDNYLFVIVNPLAGSFLRHIQKPDPQPSEETAVASGSLLATRHSPLATPENGRASTQLSAVLTHKILITHHYEPVTGVQELQGFLGRHEGQAGRGPDYLFHLILDATVDEYGPALDHVENSLDLIEEQVFRRPQQELLSTLLRLKREIIALRKGLVYQREVLARLARGEFALIDPRETAYYRNVYDHLVRFTELIEAAREMVSDLLQTHLAAVSNKLNEIMKVLTMISTVVLPMTLIAGIYGMNFKVFPELEWPFGYLWALGLMLLTGLGSFVFFKWKKWI